MISCASNVSAYAPNVRTAPIGEREGDRRVRRPPTAAEARRADRVRVRYATRMPTTSAASRPSRRPIRKVASTVIPEMEGRGSEVRQPSPGPRYPASENRSKRRRCGRGNPRQHAAGCRARAPIVGPWLISPCPSSTCPDWMPGPDAAAAFRDDLRAATHDVGFFYLTGTGISPELEQRLHSGRTGLLRAARGRQARDREHQESALPRVHARGRRAHAGPGRLARADRHRAGTRGCHRRPAPDYARLIGPNLWPAAQPELREVVSEWHDHLSGVARKLLRAWAVALGAPRVVLRPALRRAVDAASRSSAIPGKDDPTPQQGVGAHKDSGVLTLLWVEPGKGGLQVERDGEWVDAPPVPGAFVVNIGELLEYATQGYLIATNHRVVSPKYPDDRISVPFFFNPALDARLPIIELPADARGRSPRRDAGPGQPDPRALRRERAQVAAAGAP